MEEMTSVIARILLRYAAGALVAKGLVDSDLGRTLSTDVDLQMVAGVGLGLVSEFWYKAARKFGWEK